VRQATFFKNRTSSSGDSFFRQNSDNLAHFGVPGAKRILILSDVHYASAGERARANFEIVGITNPFSRLLVRFWRRWIWLKDPFAHNYLLDRFIEEAGEPDWVVANGDFSCDSAFIGVADPAARESARECLTKLRGKFGDRLLITMGDHEFGKTSLAGGRGGLRMESWRVATGELALPAVWLQRLGNFLLVGVTSSLIALEAFRAEILTEEWDEWKSLRDEHMRNIRLIFEGADAATRITLFCHDPTALPFLWEEPWFRAKIPQLERTVIGHLHTPLVFWKSQMLAGFPPVGFMGKGIHRITRALNRARLWKPFHVLLCPSLAGSQLLKDGGYYTMRLPENGPAQFIRHRLKWGK
jgi:hypothetical protein